MWRVGQQKSWSKTDKFELCGEDWPEASLGLQETQPSPSKKSVLGLERWLSLNTGHLIEERLFIRRGLIHRKIEAEREDEDDG